MPDSLSIMLANDLEELDRLSAVLESFCGEHGFPPPLTYSLELALDEIVSNIIRYGRFSERRQRIAVNIEYRNDTVFLHIKDDGVPFNPLLAEPPELDLPLEQRSRPVGGMGIHIVTSIMDRIQYFRRDGKNILEMEKAIPGECGLEEP
jgi:anti-sigma regulatory factor (Ser/Thr protein kinase)